MDEQLSFDIDNIDGANRLNNTKYTYKSSKLIETSYELSVTQQRIISLACKKMQPIYIEERITPNDLKYILGAMKFRLITISVSEFRKEYNIKGKNIYQYLEDETNGLYEKGFFYFDTDEKLKKRRWVSSCDFDRKNGEIYLTFNIDILLDLLIFKGSYVALFFDLSQNIRSKYAFRIYELLKSKVYLGNYKVDVEKFKFLLAIDNMYDDFSNLNKKVIKPNLKVINEYSDISEAFKKYNITLNSKDIQTLCNLAMEITDKRYPDMSVVDYILKKIKILDKYLENNNVESAIGFLIASMKKEFDQVPIDKIGKANSFNNFEPREVYSDEVAMDKLEKKLLGWDRDDDEDE